MPARPADPALCREDHRNRRLLDHRVHAEFNRRRGFGNGGAAAAQQGVFGVVLAQVGEIALEPGALAGRAVEQFLQLVLFGQQVITLAPQFHFLKLAQRAQPHVEDRFGLAVGQLEFDHHHRLRFVLSADDFDDPVEVEVSDDVTAQQLEPTRDLLEPVLGAAQQDVDLGDHPFLQQQLQPHHSRRALCIEHVEV